jgi:NAD(P)-dependent dehydrogenase (short-subunit alcohol dehydrogenase family)
VARFGIRVVIMEPGFVATNIAGAADTHGGSGQAVPDGYASLVARGAEYMAEQIAKAIAPERVAVAIAAEHRHPHPRYVVPASSKAVLALLTTLPDRLADRAKQRALGLS